jgi:hypothetical protein
VPQMSSSFWRAPLHAIAPLDVQGQPSLGTFATQPLIATQLPVMQTMPAAQGVVSAALPVIMQACVPVEHVVMPVLQTVEGGVQEVPETHDTQVPVLHTRLVPHGVPLLAFDCVSVQTGAPVEHDWLPTWQGAFDGVQEVPAEHVTQLPPLQTMLDPQMVPAMTLPVAMQTWLPDVQTVVPVWHTLPPGEQA